MTPTPTFTPDPVPSTGQEATAPTWHAFSADHDPADARRIYLARYGVPPAQTVTTTGRSPQLRLGPCPAR